MALGPAHVLAVLVGLFHAALFVFIRGRAGGRILLADHAADVDRVFFSQHTNVLAVAYGLAPVARQAAIMDQVMTRPDLAQALAVGDDDLQIVAVFIVFLAQQFFIGIDARLAFGLPRLLGQMNPFEFLFEPRLPRGRFFFLYGKTLGFLVEP